jgi:cytochrome b561
MMNFKNTHVNYGLVSIFLHWFMALLIIGLFVLGVYMVELDYYSKWYNAAPWWHKSIGLCVFALLLVRLVWILNNIRPTPLSNYKPWEITAAKLTHRLFYFLLIAICISGYFITTAKGASIDMFGWFNIPALMSLNKNQAAISGEIHEIAAYVMGLLFLLHVCATVKHHFFDKDATLTRILNPKENSK